MKIEEGAWPPPSLGHHLHLFCCWEWDGIHPKAFWRCVQQSDHSSGNNSKQCCQLDIFEKRSTFLKQYCIRITLFFALYCLQHLQCQNSNKLAKVGNTDWLKMRKVRSKIKQMFSNKMGESIKMVKVGISSKMLFYAERYIILIEKIASTFINVPSDNFKWAIKRLHVQISKIQTDLSFFGKIPISCDCEKNSDGIFHQTSFQVLFDVAIILWWQEAARHCVFTHPSFSPYWKTHKLTFEIWLVAHR